VYEDGVEIKHYRLAGSESLSKTLDSQEDAQILQMEQNKEGKEVTVKKILLLCDGPPKARRPNMVVFTSPNDEWFRKNDKDGHFLSMPLWTSDELQKSALVLELGLDDAEIDKRVEIFGGAARYCLHRDQSEAKSKMVEAIEANTSATEIANLLLGKMSDRRCHRLVHFEPLVNNRGLRSTKLASSFVRTRLERRLPMLDFTAREQLRKSLGEMETAASLSGWIFEINSYETLRQGCELRVTSLPEDGSAPVEISIPIAASNITDDVDTLSPSLVTYGPYHKPKAKAWESIDSLYLPKMDKPVSDMPAAKWNKANDGPLILFQMTISRRHPVNASGLVYVLSKLEFLERMEHVELVFVVPSELVGTFKRQPIVLVTAVGTDSVRSVRGVGQATSVLLSKYGIKTIDELGEAMNPPKLSKKQKKQRKKRKTAAKSTLQDEHPRRWAQIVKLWKQHELTVKYGEQVAAIAQYVGSWSES
jgi:hypothetical protein